MELTQNIINQADQIIRVKDSGSIPFKGLLVKIAAAEVKAHGFYTFVRGDEKVLIIAA